MSDDDVKSRPMGSERAFMCGVCEGQLITEAYTLHQQLVFHIAGIYGRSRDTSAPGQFGTKLWCRSVAEVSPHFGNTSPPRSVRRTLRHH